MKKPKASAEQIQAARESLASLWLDGRMTRRQAYRGAIRALNRSPLDLATLTPAMCVRLVGWVAEERHRTRAPQPARARPTGCPHANPALDPRSGRLVCECGTILR